MSAIPVVIGAGPPGLRCERAEGADPAQAEALCRAVAAALEAQAEAGAGAATALMLEISVARPDLVAARWWRDGKAGLVMQVVAMDGPLMPDWAQQMARGLVRRVPP
ncbi:hypothetical protein G5V65_17890 [Rhodobacter sp. HX-7-19]|uniref:Uncharacterized protein n=1 Tax=Paragemmobacter kunshanensis TaxID=2583234 RepID=A0A6M1TWP4_9RHOB|nr:hypothetical protein [Rhodobacter kunshanensis]NGQ92768.1 hypothetical protein [Rhodobacter kunshanensis]